MSATPFSRRAVMLGVVAGAASLAFALLVAVFGEELEEVVSADANSFSRSALGQHAFAEVLGRLGIPVVVSRHDSAGKARNSGVLVLAEPELSDEGSRRTLFDDMRARARRILVVLPKRSGRVHPLKRGWIRSAELLPAQRAQELLSALGIAGKVVRPAGPKRAWSSKGWPEPLLADPQLVSSKDLQPLVRSEEGMLAGKRALPDGRELVILADPDLIANHGLGQGKNAELAVALVEELRRGEGQVVFDETLHGFDVEPSLGRELFRFPLVLVLFQMLLAGGLLVWAGLGRFGKAIEPAAEIRAGKGTLIANTAELLRHGGHLGHALRRYWKNAMEQIARDLHAPPGLEPDALRRWLASVARARGKERGFESFEARVTRFASRGGSEHEALLLGRAVHRLREGMINGSRNHSQHE